MSLTVAFPDPHVAHVALASAPSNALGLPLLDALDDALEEVAASDARALVLSSALPRFFAAGADLKLLASTDVDGFRAFLGRLRGTCDRVAALPQTAIAAIDGMALGGGLELALGCGLRVVSPRAQLGLPEIKLGVIPGALGTQRLTHLVGPSRALDVLVTGRNVGAEEALAWGLADRVDDDPVAAALALAGEIAAFPRAATAAARRCVAAAVSGDLETGALVELEEIAALFVTDDAREGIAAFVEKRPAAFR